MSEPLLDVTICDGKYRIIQTADGGTRALRYDEPWFYVTTAVGGGMILAMAHEIEELRVKAELLVRCRDFIRLAPLDSGYCCCGSPADAHGISDGHSPVDALQYAADQLVAEIDKVMA